MAEASFFVNFEGMLIFLLYEEDTICHFVSEFDVLILGRFGCRI